MHRLTDAETRVMEILWREGTQTAGQIAKALQEAVGWNRNTSYTLIKRCIEKAAITREDPGFRCTACIPREAVQSVEANALLTSLFEGSREAFFASMLGGRRLTAPEAERLHALIDAASGEEDA